MSTAIFSAPAPAACWPACSARFRSMPARRAPASWRRPADDRRSPDCSRRRIVLALLAFGATLLRHVPEAALGGVLLFVALRIIRFSQIVTIYRQSLGEFLLIVATAAAIIVLPIEQGVARRHRAVAAARHLEHHAGPAGRSSSACPAPRSGGRPARIWRANAIPTSPSSALQAPLSFLNADEFPRRCAACPADLRRAAAAGAGSQRHSRDRLHRRADPARSDQGMPGGRRHGRDRPAGIRRARRRRSSASGSTMCCRRTASSTASMRRSGR